MEDKIFEMKLSIDKNSREFDLTLLEKIKKLSNIPVNKFDSVMKKLWSGKVVVNCGGIIRKLKNRMGNRNVSVITDVVLNLAKQDISFALY